MHKFILIIYLLFSVSKTFAQTTAQEWYRAGVSARSTQDTEAAIRCFTQAIQLNSTLIDAYYQRGWCYTNMGNYARALSDFNTILRISPKDAATLNSRGVVHQYLTNYNMAIQDYKASLEVQEDAHGYNNLGTAYEHLGELQKAREAYQKANALDPDLTEVGSNLARLNTQLKKTSNNEKVTGEALRRTVEEYLSIGGDAVDEGDYDYAITQYTKALELMPDGKAFSDRGWAKYLAGRYEEALDDFSKAMIFLEAKNKWTFNYRGMTYQKLGKYENAAQDFETALRIDPEFTSAKQNLLWIQNKLAPKTDGKPPVINIISPQEMRGFEIVRAEETITVVGQALDESGIDKVYINNTICQVNNGTGEFSASVKLVTGNNKITIVAYDTKNNKSEKVVTVNKKTVAANNTNTPTVTQRTTSGINEIIGTNYALLIGIDDYTAGQGWNNLNNPVKDINAIGEELTSNYNFNVDKLINPTLKEVNAKLKEYLQKPYKPNDQLFIFWAGHGHYDTLYKEGYIVLKDTDKDDESTYISQTILRNKISNIGCNHTFVMLDVCFGGAFSPVPIKRGSDYALGNISVEEFVAKKIKHKTRKFITSGGLEYVSDGVAGRHSPFARKVLETLRTYGGKDNLLLIEDFTENFNGLSPKICYGEFADDGAGSDFFFIAK